MPEALYDRGILSWSRHQADLPRRLARGERVNGIDWTHVVAEIDDAARGTRGPGGPVTRDRAGAGTAMTVAAEPPGT
jgi:hypothetical protein